MSLEMFKIELKAIKSSLRKAKKQKEKKGGAWIKKVLLGRVYELTPSGKLYAPKMRKEEAEDKKWFKEVRKMLKSIGATLQVGGSLQSGDEPSNLYVVKEV